MKDILILTPTLGERSTIQRTVESVAQINSLSGNRIQHRVISPKAKVDALKKTFPLVEVVQESEGGNIYSAINDGLLKDSENFRYVSYINDDDYLLLDYISLIAALDKDPTLDFVFSKTLKIDINGKAIEIIPYFPSARAFIPLRASGKTLFTQQSTLMTRSVFRKLRGFDDSYRLVADTEFWCRLLSGDCRTKFINKVTSAYMFHDSNLSFAVDGLQGDELRRLNEEFDLKSSLTSKIYLALFLVFNSPLYLKRGFLKIGWGKSTGNSIN